MEITVFPIGHILIYSRKEDVSSNISSSAMERCDLAQIRNRAKAVSSGPWHRQAEDC